MWKSILFASCVIHCAFSDYDTLLTDSPQAIQPASAIWDETSKSAFYVDFGVENCGDAPCLYRYDSIQDKTYPAYITGGFPLGKPAFIIPVQLTAPELFEFVVAFGKYIFVIQWDGISPSAQILRLLSGINDKVPYSYIGSGHRDPTGRDLYVGLEVYGSASVYLYREGTGLREVVTGLKSVDGYAFDINSGLTYILDGSFLEIIAYNSTSDGGIYDATVVFDFTTLGYNVGEFVVLGLEADTEGNLWTAGYTDGYIWKVNPSTGTAEKVLKLPFNGLTSVSFGGFNGAGDDLYVTVGVQVKNQTTGEVSINNPGTALYRVSGLGSGPAFSRLII